MKKYLKKINEKIIYPFNLNDLKKEYKKVSFPKNISKEILENFNIFEVFIDDFIPEYNKETEKIFLSKPLFENNKWIRKYNIISLTNEEKTNLLEKKRHLMEVPFDNFKIALLNYKLENGKSLYHQIIEDINKIEGEEGLKIKIKWENNVSIKRNSKTVIHITSQLPYLNDEIVDSIFENAKKL